MELLLLLQFIVVVLLRRRRRPQVWTPALSAMEGLRGAVTVRIDAPALYDIFNPTNLGNEWTVDEVGRVADDALAGLSLPFDPGNLTPTLRALDRADFNSPVALTQTLGLVAADVTQGNGGFAMYGGVNDSLDYHLWALALSMGSRYKPRQMHTADGYDVSSFYSLRQV